MKTYTAKELREILENHKRWLDGADDGARADLSSADLSFADLSYADLSYADLSYADLRSADLSFADLSYANLSYAIGNLIHIKSLQTEKYYITYTAKVIQIGCQRHTIEEWQNFDDDTIHKMDTGALEWWKKWKPILMQIIDMSPCEETK